jgi:excisionase family DNA binding protein
MSAALEVPPQPRRSAARDRAVELVGEAGVASLEAAGLLVVGRALSCAAVAELLDLNPWTVRELVRRGAFRVAKTGRHWRFDREGVLAWLRGEATIVQASTRDQGRAARSR